MITVLQLCLIVWSCFFPITTLAKSDTPGGYNQSFDYDVLNRLSTAYQGQEGNDPQAFGISSYGYDAVGNMIGSGYANV